MLVTWTDFLKNLHNYPAVSQTPHRGEADGDFVGVGECSQRPLQDICTCGLIREQLPADVLHALTSYTVPLFANEAEGLEVLIGCSLLIQHSSNSCQHIIVQAGHGTSSKQSQLTCMQAPWSPTLV